MARTTVYNKYYTNDKYSFVLDGNKDLLNEFLSYLISIDRAKLTIYNYETDVKIFFIWNYENNKNKHFTELTKREIVKFQNFLINDFKLGSDRIRRLKSSLSSMSKYIESILDEEYPNFRNIINLIPAPPKNPTREKTILTEEQLNILLDDLVSKKEYQKACVVALAMASGARKSELLRFKVDYFKDEYIIHGSLYKTPEKIKTKGRGKQGKLIEKYILVSKFKKYLNLWLEERKKLNINGEYLFYSKSGETLKISALDSWAQRFSKTIKCDFYWHSLRHFFTTELCKQNIPHDVVQGICGWDSSEMVKIYNDQTVDDNLGKYFDENGVKENTSKGLNNL